MPTIRQAVATITATGLLALGAHEALRTEAYLDPVGIPTLCYGSTKGVRMGDSRTKQECVTMLHTEAQEFANGVARLTTVPLTQPMMDSLTSFTYNVGLGAYSTSTLRRKLNAGDYCGAADQFPRWNKAGGRVLRGLTKRRADERAVFLHGVDCSDPTNPEVSITRYRYVERRPSDRAR